MKLAIDQAGSIFTGWIASCLSCLSPVGDGGDGGDGSFRYQHGMKQRGIEREMQICHAQPHLVPPMKLVVYDDLPSPGPLPRASSLPSWVMEGRRSLASRASNRASMTFGKKPTTQLRISAPTNFRHVESFATGPTKPRPLELRIYTPGNRLSDLPTFEDFQLQEERQRLLARPPKALASPTEMSRLSYSRSHRHSSSYQLPRKPVGSGSHRSSLPALEQLMENQTPITSPLVPLFSTRTSTATGISENFFSSTHIRQDSAGDYASLPKNEPRWKANDNHPSSRAPQTPPKTPLQDRPLPSIPPEDSPSEGSNTTPPRAGRVTQWLFQTSNKNNSFSSLTNSPKPNPNDKNIFRIRSRTLSTSSVVSSLTTMTGGFKTRTPSLVSGITTATTVRDTEQEPLPTEKEFEMAISRPFSSKHNNTPSMSRDRPYPTIYEGQQQQEGRENGKYNNNYYENHRQTAIGVGF